MEQHRRGLGQSRICVCFIYGQSSVVCVGRERLFVVVREEGVRASEDRADRAARCWNITSFIGLVTSSFNLVHREVLEIQFLDLVTLF